MIRHQATLRSIALAHPATIAVMERLQLDYCCGGSQTLGEACAHRQLDPDAVLAELDAAPTTAAAQPRDLTGEPLAVIVAEIVHTHHAYVRASLPQLLSMSAKVGVKHGPKHPELVELDHTLVALAEDLLQHLAKEEVVLFPYIERLELSLENGTEPPHACFASVANPVAAMISEHDTAGELLGKMRTLTRDYTLPDEACTTLRGLYAGLAAFEQDLHLHIHRENNLLFPRAIALEQSVAATA